MKREIVKIKKNGHLIAISHHWQYWLLDGIVYSVNCDGERMCVFCSEAGLGEHLHRLYQIHGHTFFTESSEILVLDKEYLSQFTYA